MTQTISGYREIILQSVNHLTVLDGINQSGESLRGSEGAPLDIPGLEDFIEYLVLSDSSVNIEKVCFFSSHLIMQT